MKTKYKALKSFSSATLGSLTVGENITIDSIVGAQLVASGLLEPAESIPLQCAGADLKTLQSSPADAVSTKRKPAKSKPRKIQEKQKL